MLNDRCNRFVLLILWTTFITAIPQYCCFPDVSSLKNTTTVGNKVPAFQFLLSDDNCEPLPPPPPNEDEPELELLDLLTKGTEFLKNYTDTNNAVLLLGNTGSGKTTVTQIIAGDLTKLHVVLAPGDVPVIIDDDNRIGLPSTKSKTLIPELVLKQDTNESTIPFYDCPGFDDTRGPVQDIAANFFMNQVASSITNVKMLFLVIYSSIKQGNDRIDFDLLAKHATTFVKNIDKFKESFGLIVNKVENFNSMGKLKEDHVIIEEIIGFLTTYNATLHSDLGSGSDEEEEMILRKIDFVETLLERDSSTGNYTKIWFVRSPMECGPLSEMEMIEHAKNNLTKLYESLAYTRVVDPEEDFGFTLKDRSLINIANYTQVINNRIAEVVSLATEDLKNRYFQLEVEPKIKDLDLEKLLNEMRNASIRLDALIVELPIASSLVTFLEYMKILFRNLENILPGKIENFLVWQDEYLTFFDKVTGKQQDRLPQIWSTSVLEFIEDFTNHKDWYEFCLELESNTTSYDFQSRKPIPPTNMDLYKWFDYIVTQNVIPVRDGIKKIYPKMAEKELRILDDLMTFALKDPQTRCTQTNVTISANFVNIGDITNYLELCTSTNSQIFIYAAHSVFFDKNVTLMDTDVVIVAPILVNPGKYLCNLKLLGSSGEPKEPLPAKSGDDASNINNRDGKPGNPGSVGAAGNPGGTSFTLANTIHSNAAILVTSKGGNGGNGQRGGSGGSGFSKNVEYEDEPEERWNSQNCWACYIYLCCSTTNHKRHGGYDGGKGGYGADGGKGGMGGFPALLTTLTLQENFQVLTENISGSNGSPGSGGNGGSGAVHGTGYYCNKPKDNKKWKCERRQECNRGSNGNRGSDGKSDLGFRQPSSPRILVEWPIILEYRVQFFNYSNMNTAKFIKEIDSNPKTKSYISLKSLAEESLALQNIDKVSSQQDRLAEMFSLIIEKLENYHQENFNNSTKINQKILSMLLTASYSSYIQLKSPSNFPIIVDVLYYFAIAKQQIETLETIESRIAIQESKEKFTQSITTKVNQATHFIETTVAESINQAGEEIEILVEAIEKQLVDLITDVKLSLEQCKEELRRAEKRQGLLKILKAFEIVSKIGSFILPGKSWSTLGTVVKKLEDQFFGQTGELEKLRELEVEITELIRELEERREKFDEEFIPFVDSLFSFWKNVTEKLASGDEISAPELGVAKWQVITKLKDCKYSLEELAESSVNARPLLNAFDRIQDAMTMSMDLYEMIDRFLETKSLADFIAAVYSAELGSEPIEDSELYHTVAQFDLTVKRNLLDEEVKNAMHAFKQWVFPFAKYYFPHGNHFQMNSDGVQDWIKEVERLNSELMRYKACIVGDQDTFIIQTNFSSGLKTSKPFFTWDNENFRQEIQALLAGTTVQLYADVTSYGMAGWEAIKFKQIEINFKLNRVTSEMQTEFDDLLEYFGITMTHGGLSNYRFQEDYFVMTGENQTLQYNFEVDANGNRLGTNQVYEKFKSGDLMLSPFTLWSIQLKNTVPILRASRGKLLREDIGFDSFKKFLPHVQVELVGIGTYVKGDEALAAAEGDLELEKWYERDSGLKTKLKV